MDILVRLIADWLMFPITAVALWALVWRVPNKVRYVRYSFILMAGISSYVVAKVLGLLWQPEQLRPFEMIGAQPGAAYLNNPGFPSDHALFAMFLALAVWYGSRNRRLGLVLIGLTLVVCLGRVLALVHTPLDVVGGILVACVGALWYLADKTTNTSSKTRKKVVQ